MRLTALAVETLGSLLRWWANQLCGLVPARIREIFLGTDAVLRIQVENDGASLRLVQRGKTSDLGHFALDSQTLKHDQALRRKLRRIERKGTEFLVCFVGLPSLRRQLILPEAAVGNLSQVVNYEVDRISPFKRSDVYVGYRLIGHDASKPGVEVEVLLVQREPVDRLVELLRSKGLHGDRFEIQGENATELVSISVPMGSSASGRTRTLVRLLAVTACILAVVAIWWPIEQLDGENAIVETQLALAHRQVAAVEKLRSQIDELKKERIALAERQKRQPSVLDVLKEMTQKLSDDAWLESLQVSRSDVVASGYANSASAVVNAISTSPMFKNVNFQAPVTQDLRLHQERFQISATLVAPKK